MSTKLKPSRLKKIEEEFSKELCIDTLLPLIIKSYVTTISYKYGSDLAKWPTILRQEFGQFLTANPLDDLEAILDLNLNQKLFPWENEKSLRVPFGTVYSSNDTVLIVFRGTTGPYEWIKNTRFVLHKAQVSTHSIEVHLGFYELYYELSLAIHKIIDELKDKRLILSGHSLGGAIVQLLALEYSDKNPIVYTFGAPRVGNVAFAKLFDSEIFRHHRVVNKGDFVPELPPSIESLPIYKHTGELLEVDSNEEADLKQKKLKLSTIDWRNHMPTSYLKALSLYS